MLCRSNALSCSRFPCPSAPHVALPHVETRLPPKPLKGESSRVQGLRITKSPEQQPARPFNKCDKISLKRAYQSLGQATNPPSAPSRTLSPTHTSRPPCRQCGSPTRRVRPNTHKPETLLHQSRAQTLTMPPTQQKSASPSAAAAASSLSSASSSSSTAPCSPWATSSSSSASPCSSGPRGLLCSSPVGTSGKARWRFGRACC